MSKFPFDTLQAAEQFFKAVQLFAASLSEEQAMEVATIYDPWKVGKNYKQGEFFTYGKNAVGDPQLYKVNQAHTSAEQWIPGAEGTDSLYTPIGLDSNGYPVWAAPTGQHDSYMNGDVVNYNGTLYQSLVDYNVWEPGAVGSESLWVEYAE